MELDGDSPPIWSQPTTTLLRQRRRQPPSPPIINPVVLILLLPIFALLILFFLVPPFLTHTTQILRPNSVKKGWDSFNILLVVFAILCGVFSRKNDDTSYVDGGASVERKRNVSTSYSSNFNDGSADDTRQNVSNDRWFEPSDEKAYNFAPIGLPETGLNRLRRSSSSYPDLRQVPQWETSENQSRFFDDFGVNLYRSTAPEYDGHRPRRSERQREEPDIKVIPVDSFEIRSSPPEPPSPEKPPITSSKPPLANFKRRRSFHSVPRKDNVEMQSNEAEVELNEKQEPPPPLPQSLPTELSPPVEKPQKLQRRKSGTKELATAIASLYNQSKRKRRTKKRDIFERVSDSPPSAEQALPLPTPPPPPPPPPPSKVFHNLFKKNRKSKRVHSDPSNVPSPPPPPPPPPSPNSIFNNLFKTGCKSKRFQQTASSTPPPPPPPPPPSILNNLLKHGTKSRRSKSPMSTPTPPPAPPPPPQAPVSSRLRKSSTPSQPPMQPPEPPRRRSSSSSKPPLPTKPVASYYDDNLNSGSQSPLIPMPPPPPMPRFKMREMKFVPSDDFIRIRSANSSRCSSPDLEDVDVDDMSVRSSLEAMDGEDSTGPSVSCPSPDVNVKADTFIARLRDEWRLEKMNSLRETSTSM